MDKFVYWLWFSRKINVGQFLWLKRIFHVKELTDEQLLARIKEDSTNE